jgi:pilus assembly protein FimV
MSIPEPVAESTAASAGGGLDFNINFDSAPAPEPAASGLDMSFDLDTAVSEPASASGGLDMDLSFGESAATESSTDLIDFSAPSLPESGGIEFDTDTGASPGGNAIEFTSEMSDSGAIELDVAAPSEVGDAALPGWDETATKLDLAKAYIDMGDSEGARSILDEVLAEGNDQQKKQARELAAQIAA